VHFSKLLCLSHEVYIKRKDGKCRAKKLCEQPSPCSWHDTVIRPRSCSMFLAHVQRASTVFAGSHESWRSLGTESVATLVDVVHGQLQRHCLWVPKSITDKLRQVLNAAIPVYVISSDQLTLPVRLWSVPSAAGRAVLVECSLVTAVQTLCNCPPTFAVHDGLLHSDHLHCWLAASAVCWLLVPHCWHLMFDCPAFFVVGLMTWNSLADSLQDPTCSFSSFHPDPKKNFRKKTFFFFGLLAYAAH